MKRIASLFILLILVTMAVGCNRVIKSEKGVFVFESKPIAGGTLRLACVEAKTLNPLMLDSKSYKDIVPLLFTGLFELQNDGSPKASLADDSRTKISGNRIRVGLKTGIRWSDGSDIQSKDIKYSFDLLKTQLGSMYYDSIKDIADCSVDGDEVVFTFNNGDARRENLTFPIVKRGTKNERKTIATSGRYKVKKYVTLDRMVLTENENWNLSTRAYIPDIEVVFINDISVFVTAFQSQEVDVVNITDCDWSKYEEIRGTTAKSYFTGEMEGLFFNRLNQKLMDKRLRKAIAYGIDRQKLMDKYVIGNGLVTDVPISPNSWLNDGAPLSYVLSYSDGKGLLADMKKNPLKIVIPTPSVSPTPSLSPTPSPTLSPTPTPTPKASNGKKGKTGKETKTGKTVPKEEKLKLSLLVNLENEKRCAEAEDIKESLKEVGIELTIEKVAFSDYVNRIKSGSYDMYLGSVLLPEEQSFTEFLDEKQALFVGKTEKNGAYILAKKLAFGGLVDTERKRAAKDFQNEFRDELPYLPLYHKKGALILSGSIKGSTDVGRYNVFTSMDKWYFEKTEK